MSIEQLTVQRMRNFTSFSYKCVSRESHAFLFDWFPLSNSHENLFLSYSPFSVISFSWAAKAKAVKGQMCQFVNMQTCSPPLSFYLKPLHTLTVCSCISRYWFVQFTYKVFKCTMTYLKMCISRGNF